MDLIYFMNNAKFIYYSFMFKGNPHNPFINLDEL